MLMHLECPRCAEERTSSEDALVIEVHKGSSTLCAIVEFR